MATFTLKCNSCGKSNTYNCSDMEWDTVESHEREMGSETYYEASCVYTCKCLNTMSVLFHCWEYPVGAVNTTEVEVSGAELKNNDCESCPDLYSGEDQTDDLS